MRNIISAFTRSTSQQLYSCFTYSIDWQSLNVADTERGRKKSWAWGVRTARNGSMIFGLWHGEMCRLTQLREEKKTRVRDCGMSRREGSVKPDVIMPYNCGRMRNKCKAIGWVNLYYWELLSTTIRADEWRNSNGLRTDTTSPWEFYCGFFFLLKVILVIIWMYSNAGWNRYEESDTKKCNFCQSEKIDENEIVEGKLFPFDCS